MIKKPFPYINNPGNRSDGVLKDVADLFGKSLRVSDAHSVVDKHFSHLVPTYNVDNLPTRVKYYHGTGARRTTFTLGMADTLGGDYFKVYTAPDNHLFTFWFNLDGGSSQPVVANTHTYVEIAVNTGDSPNIVGLALKLALEGLYSNYFYCLFDDTTDTNIEIITSQMGDNTASDSGTTGFPTYQIAGGQELIQDIEIEYVGADPKFLGQTLKGYYFDIYSGKFKKKSELVDSDGDSLDINADGSINVIVTNPQTSVVKNYYNEISGIATGVTTLVVSQVATANNLLQKVTFSGTNIAEFELVIDGNTYDKKRTYFGSSLNGEFTFNDGIAVSSGDSIELFVVHNRPMVGNFNARIQILEII